MTPPLVQYSEFYENNIRLKETGVDTLYSAATKLFHQARTVLESIPNPDQEVSFGCKRLLPLVLLWNICFHANILYLN